MAKRKAKPPESRISALIIPKTDIHKSVEPRPN